MSFSNLPPVRPRISPEDGPEITPEPIQETGAPPRPRIEADGFAAPRLDPTDLVTIAAETPAAGGLGTLGLIASGIAVLLVGLAGLQTANFVSDQFDRSSWLGGLTLAVSVAGFGLIAAGFWRELSGLFALRHVDRIRAELAAGDLRRARPELRGWLAGMPEGQAAIKAIGTIEDPGTVASLLRAGPLRAVQDQADALGRSAAIQVFAASAAMPSPAFEGLLVAWRGTRLVRQVAALYGVRPGFLGTIALLRRVVMSAAGVAATDLAANAIARALLSNPLLTHLAGDVASGGVAARRMIILARATSAACSPLPPEGRE